ncbi:DUF2934 domain-containing protein [Marinobacter sp.]|uniref:DUF2934 domain-containing protein n=1 Tax=Marinobacter sp. TaxID=50741 RepID=UPI00384C3D45
MTGEDVRIQETAYHLWESEGRPSGQDKRHWELARQMLSADESPANIPRADELPPQETPGPMPDEKPKARRRTRSAAEPAAKARTAAAKKPAATAAKKSTK